MVDDAVKAENSWDKFKPAIRKLIKDPEQFKFPKWDDIHGFDKVKQAIFQNFIQPRMAKKRTTRT